MRRTVMAAASPLIGPARADIGSPGYSGAAAISFNNAQSGGGIAVIDNGSGEAVLRGICDVILRSQQPSIAIPHRARAVAYFVTGQADACLFAPYFSNNIAEDGAAVYYSALRC